MHLYSSLFLSKSHAKSSLITLYRPHQRLPASNRRVQIELALLCQNSRSCIASSPFPASIYSLTLLLSLPFVAPQSTNNIHSVHQTGSKICVSLFSKTQKVSRLYAINIENNVGWAEARPVKVIQCLASGKLRVALRKIFEQNARCGEWEMD